MKMHSDDQQADSRSAHSTQAFDEALRHRHADAIAQVSSRTQAQLHQRRRAALSTRPAPAGASPTATRRPAWPLAASCAALLALAFGVQVWQGGVMQAPSPAVPSPDLSPPAVVVGDDGEMDSSFAALDENPDLYLWLASNDAVALASE